MVHSLGCDRGGIVGLLTLPKAEWEAIEARLLGMGFTMHDVPQRVSWRAIIAMLQNPWQPGDYVAALGVDVLQRLWWAKTQDGHDNRNPPEPLPRPGEERQKATQTHDLIAAARAAGLIGAQA